MPLSLSDRPAAEAALYAFFAAVDACDWDAVAGLMTDPIRIDYSSFGAGDAEWLAPAAICERWAGLLPGFTGTHHQLGQQLWSERDGGLHVAAAVTGDHAIDGRRWHVCGAYRIGLVDDGGVRVQQLTFDYRLQTGDLDLPAEAMARVGTDAAR